MLPVVLLASLLLAGCGVVPALADTVEPDGSVVVEPAPSEGVEAVTVEDEPEADVDALVRIEDAVGTVDGKVDALADGQQSVRDDLARISGAQAEMSASLEAARAESADNEDVLTAIADLRDILCVGVAALAALLGALALMPFWLSVAGGPHGR